MKIIRKKSTSHGTKTRKKTISHEIKIFIAHSVLTVAQKWDGKSKIKWKTQ